MEPSIEPDSCVIMANDGVILDFSECIEFWASWILILFHALSYVNWKVNSVILNINYVLLDWDIVHIFA